MKNNISVVVVIYNEEKLLRRCLDSVKPIADEILILHDGPCKDKSLEIAREYTPHVFKTKKNYGVPGMILPILFRKVKYNWILKIDADEFLSKPLQKNIRKLIEDPNADAYMFSWPYWDGKKYTTKDWPAKMPLYRKSKMSYIGFPHWDDPKINGNIVRSKLVLEHRHYKMSGTPTVKEFINKGLKRYMALQAKYTLKDFKELDKFQCDEKDFPLALRIRRTFPLITALPFGILAFFKTLLSNGAWKEGKPVVMEALGTIIYYTALGIYIFKLKIGSNFKKIN